jgi:hypothetical protein
MGRLLLLTLAAWVALLGVGPVAKKPGSEDLSDARYVSDLGHSNAARRLYAARVLRTRASHADRIRLRADPSSWAYDEALGTLESLDEAVPACVARLADDPKVGPVCADILGYLEAEEAWTALEQAATARPGSRLARRARRALERIDAARRQEAPTSSEPTSPGVPTSPTPGETAPSPLP